MTKKKNSFLTFIFSLIPGAGQMYMGFMKRGTSLMSIFFLIIFVSVLFESGILLFAIPIIWFYGFFDTFNLRSMPDEAFCTLKDNYILISELDESKAKVLQSKYRSVLAVVLIFIGVKILWDNLYSIFGTYLPEMLKDMISSTGHYLTQLFIAAAIIFLGVHLIRGKKKELYQEEPSYPQLTIQGGGNNENS